MTDGHIVLRTPAAVKRTPCIFGGRSRIGNAPHRQSATHTPLGMSVVAPSVRTFSNSGRGAPAIPCGRQESLRHGGPGLHRRCLGLGREVKRGEIWRVAGGKDYAEKPRPVVIVQDDRFDMTNSVTVCAFTSDPSNAPLFRLRIEPSEGNGLRIVCRLMVDKITTVPKAKVGVRIGRLADKDMVRLNRAVLLFLGIAAPPNQGSESE